VCRDIAILEPLIKRCIPLPIKKLYKHVRRRLRTIDEVEQYFPGFKAFFYRFYRTGDSKTNEQKKKEELYYSGKKKKHTVKTQYMVNTKGLILQHKTGYIRKVENMIMIFTKTQSSCYSPLQVENIFDLGYLGIEKDFPTTVKSVLPIRKRRNNMLSYEETTYNKKHSQLRIIIEHTIYAD
jgi:DDE superfamily endonuclease